MPEGHTLHRLAQSLGQRFGGQDVEVSSPQGRFVSAAALIDGTELLGAEAWGKHLFIAFAGQRYVHVHLGLYGRFDVRDVNDGAPPAPVGQVRLRIVGQGAYADLRGATACDLLTETERTTVVDRLGPDPLRDDADFEKVWTRLSASRTSIGALLMDQTVLAGVGNVYRAEVLFRHRIHPLRPGRSLRRGQVLAMWEDLVELMHHGVEVGRIYSIRPQHTEVAGSRERLPDDHGGVYVYRRAARPCHVCGSKVRTEVLAGRNLFWCPTCQPKFRSRARTR
ncbi:MAG: Fpg/Nei family DNA glycosylase [Actinomycetota bacterium]|nr:Fpg/Nei family DNA glycosylase [Actinomycetota bacterium]